MSSRIDWRKVWEAFDASYVSGYWRRTLACPHSFGIGESVSSERAREQIRRLVEAQLKAKPKRVKP